MLLRIFDIIRTVSISIYASLIDANNRPVINVSTSLINSRNNSNNCKKNQEDWRYQKILKKSTSLFLVNSVYKNIGSTHF